MTQEVLRAQLDTARTRIATALKWGAGRVGMPAMLTLLAFTLATCKKPPNVPQPLGAPSLQSPAEDTTLRDNHPTLTWSSVSGAKSYEVSVDGPTFFSESTASPECHLNCINYDTGHGPLPDGDYTWKVQAFDSAGRAGDWSGDGRFRVRTVKWVFPMPVGYGKVSGPTLGPDGTVYAVLAPPWGTRKWSYLLVAINDDGTQKWQRELSSDTSILGAGDFGNPFVGPDGTIYVSCQHSPDSIFVELVAVRPDGSIAWRHYARGGCGVRAIGADGSVYCGSWSGYVQCVNGDGTTRWTGPDAHGGTSIAIGADGIIYCIDAGSAGTEISALSPTGGLIWSFSDPNVYYRVAITANGNIVVAGTQVALVSPSGAVQWRRQCGSENALTCDSSIIYVQDTDGSCALREEDGTELWSSDTLIPCSPEAIASNLGPLYASGASGLYELALDGSAIGEYFSYTGEYIIGDDGTVYAGHGVGSGWEGDSPYLVALYGHAVPDIKHGWPMDDHDPQRTRRAR